MDFLTQITVSISGFHKYNLDGFVTYLPGKPTEACHSYCQMFFDGTIETVSAEILRTKKGGYPQPGEIAYISSVYFERSVVMAIKNYIKGYKSLGIDPPIIVSVVLRGCKGAHMSTDFDPGLDIVPLDRNEAILPQVQIFSLDEDVPTIMKPIFDAVWNAFGLPRSYNYTDNGTWNIRSI